MNCNRTPDTGNSIYMANCSCNCLWNEVDTGCENCSVNGLRIGMTYTPMQPWGQIYDLDTGLRAGTIFPCLHMPFIGGGGR